MNSESQIEAWSHHKTWANNGELGRHMNTSKAQSEEAE
jgi:hypothetical protein